MSVIETHVRHILLKTEGSDEATVKPKAEAPKAAPEAVVKIGQVSPLTGPQAHLGKDNDNGAKLAIEEANAKGITIGGEVYF